MARIIMFHEVGVPSMTTRAFTNQVRYLASHFRVVSLAELVAALKNASPLPQDAVILTFDDGLRSHAATAAPILAEFSAPATFFVNPGLVDERRWQWANESEGRLESLPAGRREKVAGAFQCAAQDPASIVELMKRLPLPERLSAESVIRDETKSFVPTPSQRLRFDLMSWEEILALDSDLITIGSHTSTHPILRGLDAGFAEAEIAGSRTRLEARLGRAVEFFCYPNGDFDDVSLGIVRRSYDAAVSTACGVVTTDDDRHGLNRLPAASSVAYLAWRLHRYTA